MMRNWLVVYNVKFSEEWCADECGWVEYSAVIRATTKRTAQLTFRKEHSDLPRFLIGRHVSTRLAEE